MLEQRAQVIAVERRQLKLMPLQRPDCPRCAAGNGCGAQLFGPANARALPVTVAASDELAVVAGDIVVVGVQPQLLQYAALLLYGLPLLVVLLIAAGSSWLALSEAWQVLLVVLGLVGSFLYVRRPANLLTGQPTLILLRKESPDAVCVPS